MVKLVDVIASVEKKHGEGIGTMGGWYETSGRIPTGIFPLDLAIGGGIPKGRVTEIYGPEGSGKTNTAIKAMAMMQQLEPDKFGVVFDMEGTYDPVWAAKLGVDDKRVYVARPDYAEELNDMMCEFLLAEDVGLILLDSLASVITVKEGNESAEKAMMGNSAIAIKRMVNKMTTVMKRRRMDKKHLPAVIFINQTRTALNVMFGDPETTPGGKAPLFMYSLRLRLYGKGKMDKAVSEILPVSRETSVVVKKHKVAVTAINAKYEFITQPHDGFQIGDVDDWGLVEALCRANESMVKTKKGYEWRGQSFPTLAAMKALYRSDTALRLQVQAELTKQAIDQSGYGIEGELVEGVHFDPETGEIFEEAA